MKANERETSLVYESEVKPSSGNAKTEGSRKGFWYPEELDRDNWRSLRASITCQTLLPGKTVVGSLGAGDQSNWRRLGRWSRFSEFDIDALVTKEFHNLSSMKAPLPVSPHNGS